MSEKEMVDVKIAAYEEVAKEIGAVIEGESNLTARMATISCLLYQKFDRYFWTGFYVVDPENPEELVIGPYQGPIGCLRIPFGKGVCGTSAARRETIIVDDVDAFPGHIACSDVSRSEIVVPVFGALGDLMAVLDVDADEPAMFDAVDQKFLERIVKSSFAAA